MVKLGMDEMARMADTVLWPHAVVYAETKWCGDGRAFPLTTGSPLLTHLFKIIVFKNDRSL